MAAAVTAAAALTSCGGASAPAGGQRASATREPEPAPTTRMTCNGGFSFGGQKFAAGWRHRAVVAGPIAIMGLRGHEKGDFEARRSRVVYAKALLAPGRTTTLAVAEADRPHVSLSIHIQGVLRTDVEGDAAITFEGCPPRVDDTREGEELGTGYAFTVIVDGPRCASFEITPEGRPTVRRTVGFGVGGCES